MAKKIPQCWSCLVFFSEQLGGIALDGSDEQHICVKCWRKIPVAKRVMIAAVMRTRDSGGLGLGDFVARLNLALDAAGIDADTREALFKFPSRN